MAAGPIADPTQSARDAFDASHYLATNPDVAAAGLDPWTHFAAHGWREGRNPTADFSVAQYLELNPDVAAAGINPFVHCILYGRDEDRPGRPPEGFPDDMADVRAAFDETHYRAANPDVDDVDPFAHFMQRGWSEGRDPSPSFSVSAYLEAHPDIATAGLNPLVHWVRYGRAEGRALRTLASLDRAAPGAAQADSDPVRAAFDESHYRAQSPRLPTDQDAFAHFMDGGWRSGRDPAPWFSIARYLQLNPDIEAAGINPFAHYVLHGRTEGRPLSHGLDFRNDILRLAPPFEAHLHMLRQASPDPAPTSIAVLETALAHRGGGDRLHITVSQDDYVDALGGIQLCLRIESAAVRASGVDHLHLFPPAPGMVVEINRERPPIGVVLNDRFLGHFAVDDLVALAEAQPRAAISLAVHSLIGHVTEDVVSVLAALGASAGFYWVHDYSSLCAGYALMRNDVTFCGAPPPDSAACRVCQYGPRRRIQVREHARLFDAFAMTVLAPSDSALALWRGSFPRRPVTAVAHPHATLGPRRTPRRAPGEVADRPLRVGFLGMPTHHKGWPAFAALAEGFRADPRYEFHHLARRAGEGVVMRFTSVAPTAADPDPMRQAVEDLDLDVVVLWSLWPETFCFTAFEAVAGGAAIITNPAAGNVTAFVRERGCGLVVDSEDALYALFRSGEILKQSRSARKARLQTLTFTRMTADFLPEATA